ncbi:hypothetical protein HRbin12_00977 [bacterium HR12]|nr:hypothetical protein HRbin12_00977 [bacterium HR12]
MIGYRHVDARFPFLWEASDQPPARWHGAGEGPVHTFADTPDGAWAELLRHEEITDPEDVLTIRRGLWAVELGDVEDLPRPRLPRRTLTGGTETYEACRREARRLRARGAVGLVAPSAALREGGAHGWCVDGGLRPGPRRDGRTVVLFGRRPDLVGWAAAAEGRPDPSLLDRVRPLRA